MIPIRAVSARLLERITLAPLAEPISVSLSMDEEWSPRMQGTITVPDTADLSGGLLWKHQGDTITLELVTRYGPMLGVAGDGDPGGSCAALTARFGGSVARWREDLTRPWNPGEHIEPLSTATGLWGGAVAAVTTDHAGDVDAITGRLRVAGGSYRIRPTERLLLRLRVRRILPSAQEGTIVYEVAGEDTRLHDYRRTSTTAKTFTERFSLRQVVHEVLTEIAAGSNPVYSIGLHPGPDIAIPESALWDPAVSAWEFLQPILEAVGWTLYADTDGLHRLHPRSTETAPVILDATDNLSRWEPVTDYETAYYDGAMVEYLDAEPLDPRRWDVYMMPGATRILHETRPGIRHLPGAAEQLVTRSRTRAGRATAHATVQLGLRPGHRVEVRLPPYDAHGTPVVPVHHGTLATLTHTYPDAETTFGFRDVI
ncbi:hypothetical protein [Leucobacter triazinivorans]|uniref:DUF5047 domain-containing protein n=1 Tax=Leucobacter triazinivorans TaxID=1784719 RepID=A0A4P6KEC0_9MICO|nr:hypothetical protein [Leucobacter triazinivorans]QBE48746.1 hypothetical protein EVS81_07805 [Leucobacter triazinivorans]